jgi:hypothetical protein
MAFGTTPPRMPRAVPLPPALPVTTVILPWADTEVTRVRAERRMMYNMLADEVLEVDTARKD